MLSIIIPTLNEEDYLPALLRSIKSQTFKDYEIIVADAGSKDKTQEIARKSGCRVILGGLPGKGRNEGAKAARGDLLLFLDADTKLTTKKFIGKMLIEFKERNLDIACCVLKPMGKSRFFTRELLEFLFWLASCFWFFDENSSSPTGIGSMILVKKDFHQKIGDFSENVHLGEDSLYIKKAARHGRYGVLKSVKILWSIRRLEQEKWLRVMFLYILPGFLVYDEEKMKIFNKGFLEYRLGTCYNEFKKFNNLTGSDLFYSKFLSLFLSKKAFRDFKAKNFKNLVRNKYKNILEIFKI